MALNRQNLSNFVFINLCLLLSLQAKQENWFEECALSLELCMLQEKDFQQRGITPSPLQNPNRFLPESIKLNDVNYSPRVFGTTNANSFKNNVGENIISQRGNFNGNPYEAVTPTLSKGPKPGKYKRF